MNLCLHCALFERLEEWGLEHGAGEDEGGRFTTLGQGRAAIGQLLGDMIAGSLPLSEKENAGYRLNHVRMVCAEITAAMMESDAAVAMEPAGSHSIN